MSGRKSLILAYTFAILGGLFGLHHLYLGRTQHALLWFTTLGGFGIGWAYELFFLLTKYVHEANEDDVILNKYLRKMLERKSPAFEILRLCGQYFMAVFYGFITYFAFPETWHANSWLMFLIGCCSATAIAAGTQLVGTIGPRQCSFIWPFLGAILGMPFIVWSDSSSPSFNVPAFLASWIFEWKIEWNPTYFSNLFPKKTAEERSPIASTRKRRHIVKRCLLFGVGVIVFSAIFTSAIYQNLQVDINGRRVAVKDVLHDFFKPQQLLSLYKQISSVLRQLWSFYLRFGLTGIWTEMWMALESESENKAFETLNLSSTASQRQIESQCRTLSREWHPDRYREPEQKRKAEAIFMDIQQACDRLSNERKRRHQLNTQGHDNPN